MGVLVASGAMYACGSSSSTTAASSSTASTVEPSTTSTTPTEAYCIPMRKVADFEAALRAAGDDRQQVVAVYTTLNADNTIENAYDSANHEVPVDEPAVKVGLNLGELFTGYIDSDLNEGKPLAVANARRADVDWLRGQAKVDQYTQQRCGFTVYQTATTTTETVG